MERFIVTWKWDFFFVFKATYVIRNASDPNFRLECWRKLDIRKFSIQHGCPVYQHWAKAVHCTIYYWQKSCANTSSSTCIILVLSRAGTMTHGSVTCQNCLTGITVATEASMLFRLATVTNVMSFLAPNFNFRGKWNPPLAMELMKQPDKAVGRGKKEPSLQYLVTSVPLHAFSMTTGCY